MSRWWPPLVRTLTPSQTPRWEMQMTSARDLHRWYHKIFCCVKMDKSKKKQKGKRKLTTTLSGPLNELAENVESEDRLGRKSVSGWGSNLGLWIQLLDLRVPKRGSGGLPPPSSEFATASSHFDQVTLVPSTGFCRAVLYDRGHVQVPLPFGCSSETPDCRTCTAWVCQCVQEGRTKKQASVISRVAVNGAVGGLPTAVGE